MTDPEEWALYPHTFSDPDAYESDRIKRYAPARLGDPITHARDLIRARGLRPALDRLAAQYERSLGPISNEEAA